MNAEKEHQFKTLQKAVRDAADAPQMPFIEIECQL